MTTEYTKYWVYTTPKGKVIQRVIATENETQEAGDSIIPEIERDYGVTGVKATKVDVPVKPRHQFLNFRCLD